MACTGCILMSHTGSTLCLLRSVLLVRGFEGVSARFLPHGYFSFLFKVQQEYENIFPKK